MAKPAIDEVLINAQASVVRTYFNKATNAFRFEPAVLTKGTIPSHLANELRVFTEKLHTGEITPGSSAYKAMGDKLAKYIGDNPVKINGKILPSFSKLGELGGTSIKTAADVTKKVITKNVLIGGGVVLVAAVGVGGYALYKKRKAKKEIEQSN